MNVTASPIYLELVRPPADWGFWRRLVSPQLYRLMATVRVEIGDGDHHHLIVVPAGLVTDFASVPRCIKLLFPESVLIGVAALVHDQLYKSGAVGKRVADALFAGLAQDCDHAPNWMAELLFLGVHVGGFAAWNAHRKNDAESTTGRAA